MVEVSSQISQVGLLLSLCIGSEDRLQCQVYPLHLEIWFDDSILIDSIIHLLFELIQTSLQLVILFCQVPILCHRYLVLSHQLLCFLLTFLVLLLIVMLWLVMEIVLWVVIGIGHWWRQRSHAQLRVASRPTKVLILTRYDVWIGWQLVLWHNVPILLLLLHLLLMVG